MDNAKIRKALSLIEEAVALARMAVLIEEPKDDPPAPPKLEVGCKVSYAISIEAGKAGAYPVLSYTVWRLHQYRNHIFAIIDHQSELKTVLASELIVVEAATPMSKDVVQIHSEDHTNNELAIVGRVHGDRHPKEYMLTTVCGSFHHLAQENFTIMFRPQAKGE